MKAGLVLAALAASVAPVWAPQEVSAAIPATFQLPAAQAPAPLPLDPAIPPALWQPGSVPEQGAFENLTTRTPAPHQTNVWMMYDSRNLYVAFRAEQNGIPIVATQTTNDVGLGSDDFVGVEIDTSAAGSQDYIFMTTPRGVRYQEASDNTRYRPAWQSAAKISGGDWSAVMVIPLNAMRLRSQSPQTWRVNFIRNVAAVAEHYTWVFNGLMGDGPIPNQWPNWWDARFWASWTGLSVQGAATHSKPHPELYFLESAGRDHAIFQQAGQVFLPQNARVMGFDLTYPMTNTINFVGTLNPDFSNVEVDQQTIQPQEFRRYLQEYRPFFAQGADFLMPDQSQSPPYVDIPFYSPAIGPFDRGEKVEGTFGNQSFGILNFKGFDQITGNTFDDTAFAYSHAVQNRTFSYWADGVLAHHSIFGDDSTVQTGFFLQNDKSGLGIAAHQAFEEGNWLPQRFSHHSEAVILLQKPNLSGGLDYRDIGPNYNPIDGITGNSDIRGLRETILSSGTTPFMKSIFGAVDADRYIDESGAVHQEDFTLLLGGTFRNGFSIPQGLYHTGTLRSYAIADPATFGTTCSSPVLPRSYFTGFPRYFCGRNDPFNYTLIPVGYRDGTPTPIDVSAQFGAFGYGMVGQNDTGPDYLHYYTFSTSRPLGHRFTLGVEYDGSFERAMASGAYDSQWLRRVTFGAELGEDENLSISLRAINGTGGFSLPGVNLAAAFHRKMPNGDEIFLNFGTPAATRTLDRFVFKYLFNFGGAPGT